NYVCRQRVSEVGGKGEQLSLHGGGAGPLDAAGADPPVADAALMPNTAGDRAELDFEPHFRAWAMVSTTARECPGAFRCPSGRECFAEDARARAAEADVVVVNTHLYGAHLASGGAVLPPHQIAVFDEAHEVEEVMTDSLGVDIGPGRFRALAATARGVVPARSSGSDNTLDLVAEVADQLQRVLRPLAGTRIPRGIIVGV